MYRGVSGPVFVPGPGPSSDVPAYAVGVVNFHTYRDLGCCLRSVSAQRTSASAIAVVDNDPDATQLDAARRSHPDVCFEARSNLGYAASANRLLSLLAGRAPEAEFFLILNPDVELEAEFAVHLLREMQRCGVAALGCGKLLRPEDRTIDSAGITLPRNRRPRDRGSGEEDRGQYESSEFVFGASGAALMIRASALEDLAIEGEVFDEDFFMYHEDTDLAWRARLLGWRVLYVPSARARHTRQWRRDRRFQIPTSIRRHSFKNHYLQLIKNERASDFLVNLPVIASWELMRLAYALTRDRSVLGGYRDAWQLAGRAWCKRRILHDRARDRRQRTAANPLARRLGRSVSAPRMDRGDERVRPPAV